MPQRSPQLQHARSQRGSALTSLRLNRVSDFTGLEVGTYKLGKVLGRGHTTVVLEATAAGGHAVVIKFIHSELATSAVLETMRAWVALDAALASDHTVPVFELSTAQGLPYFVTERADAPRLSELLTEDGPFEWSRVRDIMLQLARLVGRWHAGNEFGRELAARKILLEQRAVPAAPGSDPYRSAGATQKDHVRVELAVPAANATTTDPNQAFHGQWLGYFQYRAPEIHMGRKATAASDIYGLGVLLYELATAVLPYGEISPAGLIVASMRPPALSSSLPEPAREIVLRCLNRQREDRYPNIDALIDALRAAT